MKIAVPDRTVAVNLPRGCVNICSWTNGEDIAIYDYIHYLPPSSCWPAMSRHHGVADVIFNFVSSHNHILTFMGEFRFEEFSILAESIGFAK